MRASCAVAVLIFAALLVSPGCKGSGSWAHPDSFSEPPQHTQDISRSQW
jgi:hypothetical protein